MTTKQKINDLRHEIENLRQSEVSAYYPKWEWERDIARLNAELQMLLAK